MNGRHPLSTSHVWAEPIGEGRVLLCWRSSGAAGRLLQRPMSIWERVRWAWSGHLPTP